MITLLRRLFFTLSLLLVVVAATIFLLVSTETGTKFTLHTIARLGVAPIAFQDLRGNLISAVTLTKASYKTAAITVTLDDLTVKWHPLALLRGKLLLDNLTLNNAAITLSNSSQPHQKPTQNSSFSLPFQVQINQLNLQNIAITSNAAQPIRIKSLTGNVNVGNKALDANLDADLLSPLAMTLHFNINGQLSDYQWGLKLNNSFSNWTMHGSGNSHSIALITDQSQLLGGQLAAAVSFEWSPALSWDFSIKANKLNLDTIAGGLPHNLSLTANSKGDMQTFNLAVTGLQGKLKNFPLAGYINLNGQLKANNSAISASGLLGYLQRMNFNVDTQVKLGNANLNMQGSLAQNWNLQFNLYTDALNKLTSQLGGAIKLQGSITGDASQPQLNTKILLNQLKMHSVPNASFQGEITVATSLASSNKLCNLFSGDYSDCILSLLIKLTKGQLTYPINNKKVNFPIAGTLTMHYDPLGLNSQLELLLYGKKLLALQLALPKYKLTFPLPPTQIVTGKLLAAVDQSQLKDILPTNIHVVNSALNANVQIAGTVNRPKLQGSVHVKSDNIDIPQVAIKLLGLRADIILNNEVIHYEGSVKSGPGHLQLNGKSLLTDHGLDSTIAISGTQFQVCNTPKMQIFASPKLTILSDAKGWRITGNLLIPTATIQQNDVNQALTLPSETIIIDANGQMQQSHQSLPIATQVTLELGNNVQINASGLSGRIVGKLEIGDDSRGNTTATGTLNLVDANYNLQGEKLTISPGNIIFMDSPIANPQLDVRATKKINYHSQEQIFSQEDNLTVGVSVKGTVENPKITLFSNPSGGWSQADILSLILIGQPASQATGSQVQLLARAAQALTAKNGVGVSSVTQQVQRMFGLSEFELNSEVNNQAGNYSQGTSLVVGKSISPRLNLSYSLNVFNSINTLRVRYLLSKHWFIQTESNTLGKGADIIYTVGK